MLYRAVSEGVGNLLATSQRSFLALLGILIGAAAVIAMLDVGAMAKNETVKQFNQMGTDMVSIHSADTTGLKLTDTLDLLASAPALDNVVPIINSNMTVSFEGKSKNTTIIGTTASMASITHSYMENGRFISDFDKFELYCVVGSAIAVDLSSKTFPLKPGSRLRIGRYVFEVVGIIAPSLQNPMVPMSVNDSVFMSLPNSTRVTGTAMVDTALARMRRETDPDIAIAQINAHFGPKLHGARLVIHSAQQLIAGRAHQQSLFEVMLGAIGAISLLLGGVGVMNIMLVSVQERRHEIGIRLAVGARRRDVQMLFLVEALIVVMLGAALGTVAGLVMSYVFARLSGWDFLVWMPSIPLGAGMSVAIGIVSGFYPAVLASRLEPIDALKSE